MTEEYIYVAVDETGNLGKSLKGERYYTLVACVVNDRERFENATRRLGYREEVKFYTHDFLREKVLEYAVPAVSDIFYVRYHKKKRILDKFEQANLHLDMIQSLADTIVLSYGMYSNIAVEVDHKDGISDVKICNVFENNEYRRNYVTCDVLDSSESYGLQTNDFFVGAIGQMLNHADTKYIRYFGNRPREAYIRSKNEKKQGEPASVVWRSTGHTDSPMKDSPPGIAERVRIHDAGCPSVRLMDSRDSEYLKCSEISRIFRRGRI